MSLRIRVALVAMLSVTIAAVLAVSAHARPLLLQNGSPSLPPGTYLLTTAQPSKGAVVAIAQPRLGRPYLASLGYRRDTLLLKRVAAQGGDAVCAAGDALQINGQVFRRRFADRTGHALPSWNGCRRLAAHELMLLGDTASSFDGRYFGPVDRAAVVGVYRRLG
ncbi:MAG TPA: S26 family signal peptidase [Phenylobacterium sp.]